MKKGLLAVVAGAAVLAGSSLMAAESTAVAPAQGIIKTIISGIPHAALFGISFKGNDGVAVGTNGSVFESSDGGSSWKPVTDGATDLALLAVDNHGPQPIAVGQAGVVLVEDSPGHWSKVDAGTTGRLMSVSANSHGLVVIGGEFGTLLKSTDGGKTWAAFGPKWDDYADPDTPGTNNPQIYSVHVSETGQITVAGEFGMIFRLDDPNSDKWRPLHPIKGGAPSIFATCFPERGPSYAVGQTGEVLISPDGGETWIHHPVPTYTNFLGVAYAPGGRVVITGMHVMQRSDDGGITWKSVEDGDVLTDWYQAVRYVASSDRFLAVGHAGKIIQIGKQAG